MPLHTDYKVFFRMVYRFDDAVICCRHAAQRFCQFIDCLMMQAVYSDLQQTLAELMQRCIPNNINFVR